MPTATTTIMDGARLLARMSPTLVRAVIAEAQLSDPAIAAELERVLLGRREKLLRRYLGRLSPLTRPRVDEHEQLCVVDARREAGLESGPVERCTPIAASVTRPSTKCCSAFTTRL